MSGGTVSQPKTITTGDSKQDMQNYLAGGAGAAKVTLIKPVQAQDTGQQDNMAESNAIEKLSYARPKVGRASAGSVSQETRLPSFTTKEEPQKTELPPIPRDLTEMTSTRPWDFKFALVLVTLFIAVNLGLVLLLHNNHHAGKNAVSESVLAEKEKPPAPHVPVVSQAAVTPSTETAAAPIPPALPPAAPPSLAGVPAPVNVPASVAAAPAVIAPSVTPIPSAAEVPAPAVAVDTPPAALVTAPAQLPATVASAPAVAPASSQDLLSIIGKN